MASKKTKRNTRTDKSVITQNKDLAKKLTPEQIDNAKKHLIEHLKTAFDSEGIVEKLWQDFLPSIEAGKSKVTVTKEYREQYRQAMAVYGLDNHVPLSETVAKEYRPLAVEFSYQLVKDYNCQTAAEKALVETVASAYIRLLVMSRRLNGIIGRDEIPISAEDTSFYSMLSKELDRANRHFTTALQTLVQLKQPSINVNLKAKNAYVAQAQQFNMDKPEPRPDEEIINPK